MRAPLALLALCFGVPAQSAIGQSAADATVVNEFDIEASHSAVSFSIGFVGLPVRGTFDDVNGTIVYAPHQPESSSVTVAIATSSIHTGSEHRDAHLKSSDFFDAKKYPVILFRSTGIARTPQGLQMSGTLRMHGVTREIAFPFTESPLSPISEPHGATLIQFTARLRLARKDFGITGGSAYNTWFDAVRQASMADSVDVNIEVTGWDPDYTRPNRYDASLARLDKDGMPATISRLRAMYRQNPDTLKDSEWDFLQIAHALQQRRRYAQARDVLVLSTEFFPKSADVEAALGRTYELLGNRREALLHANRALTLEADAPRALELKRRLGG
jgi:polyisoprenoid-binding protein YceI